MNYYVTVGTDFLITSEDVRELANLLVGIAAIWKLIGIQLRLTLGTLDNIANSCTKVEECLVRMLSKWIDVYGHEATVSRLIAALKSKSVKELRIAEEVQKHFHTKRGWSFYRYFIQACSSVFDPTIVETSMFVKNSNGMRVL